MPAPLLEVLRRNAGRALVRRDWSAAEGLLNQLREADPGSPQTRCLEAELAIQTGEVARGRALAEAVAHAHPASPKALWVAGLGAYRAKAWSEAVEHFRESEALFSSGRTRWWLGKALTCARSFDEAEALLVEVVAERPYAAGDLAFLYQCRGDSAAALRVLDRHAADLEDNPRAAGLRARLRARRVDPEDLLEELDALGTVGEQVAPEVLGATLVALVDADRAAEALELVRARVEELSTSQLLDAGWDLYRRQAYDLAWPLFARALPAQRGNIKFLGPLEKTAARAGQLPALLELYAVHAPQQKALYGRSKRLRRRHGLEGVTVLVAVLGCAGVDEPGAVARPFPGELGARLDTALAAAHAETDAPGASAAVVTTEGAVWVGVRGVSRLDTQAPTQPADLFRIGSITKTYLAIAVLQLEEEGALDLDTPAAALLPWAPHADAYTLRQLLAHTSGLDDHVDRAAFLGDLDRPWTPRELASVIADDPLLFEPGSAMSYSNTGYILLGAAVEEATGLGWGAHVRARVLEPLGLERTWIPSVDRVPPPLAHGYLGSAAGGLSDVTWDLHATSQGAGGELIATAADVALLGASYDTLLGAAALTAMQEESSFAGEGTGYGLGLSVVERDGVVLLGHSGSTLGYQSRLHVAEGYAVATLVNNFFAEADDLDAALWDVLLE